MTNNLSNTSMPKTKENKANLKYRTESILVFINKHKKKLGYRVDALELMRKYCGRG